MEVSLISTPTTQMEVKTSVDTSSTDRYVCQFSTVFLIILQVEVLQQHQKSHDPHFALTSQLSLLNMTGAGN